MTDLMEALLSTSTKLPFKITWLWTPITGSAAPGGISGPWRSSIIWMKRGSTLFDRYEKAAFQENSCLLEAMFLATVDLCRELERKADRLSVQPPPVIPPPSSWRRSFSRRSS